MVGTPFEQLMKQEYEGDREVIDAAYLNLFGQVLTKKTTPDQVRHMASQLERVIETPGLFLLTNRLIDVLVESHTREEVVGRLVEVIHSSDIWNGRERSDPRGNK